ncbi:MAG: 1-acyl-sn-glycerol-3-phosphate acyltransferase [Firmicutes bacterium]|nr:1-acyl-sn-glycerol-3-phosphate acyltransferase [Bacillota bacterium]
MKSKNMTSEAIKVRWRHRAFFWFLRVFIVRFVWRKYGYKPVKFSEKKAGIKPPYLVLAPHVAQLDPALLASGFRRQIYFVSNADLMHQGLVSKILRFTLSPIPKKKGIPDIVTVRNIAGIKNQGGVVGIFPSGNTTFTGRGDPFGVTTARLVKMLKIPVVFYSFGELFFCVPRFSDTGRRPEKGRVTGRVTRVMMPEEYAELTPEQIHEILVAELCPNYYVTQRKNMRPFKGENLAQYVERAVFWCPECGGFGMKSEGGLFGCPECGYQVRYNKYGFFEDCGRGVVYDNVADWYDAQVVFAEGKEYPQGSLVTADPDCSVFDYKENGDSRPVATGSLSFYTDRLELDYGKNEKIIFKLDDIEELIVIKRKFVLFYTKGGGVYRISGRANFGLCKYLVLFHALRTKKQ